MDEETTATATENAENNGTATEQQQTQQQAPPSKTYTEDEYKKMSTGQYAAGLAAAMKEAGFEATKGEDFKKQMKAFREWQDTQKSDLQKAQDSIGSITKERDDALAELSMSQRRFAAIGKGVSADKADKYVKLAESYLGEDGDFDKALDAALVDFPVEKKEAPPPYASGTGTGRGQTTDDIFEQKLSKYKT